MLVPQSKVVWPKIQIPNIDWFWGNKLSGEYSRDQHNLNTDEYLKIISFESNNRRNLVLFVGRSIRFTINKRQILQVCVMF